MSCVSLDFNYAKIPKDATEKDFYLKKMPVKQELPWFSSMPVGRNELSKLVPKMCGDAGVAGK